MSNMVLNVTLSNGSLDVDQTGNGNQIPHGENDTITWQLTGSAASGQFNAMNASNPGFNWTQTTPDGVFGTATVQANGNQIQISDNNTDPNGVNSAGTWIYQLYATIGGTQYSTKTIPSPRAVTNNPTIQNM